LGRRDWKAWRDRMARSNTTYKYYVNVLVFTVFISICFYWPVSHTWGLEGQDGKIKCVSFLLFSYQYVSFGCFTHMRVGGIGCQYQILAPILRSFVSFIYMSRLTCFTHLRFRGNWGQGQILHK